MWKRLHKICSNHRKRGDKISYFNLSPFYYEQFRAHAIGDIVYKYMDDRIPVICEGWKKIDDMDVYILTTPDGPIHTHDLIYALK